MPDWDWTTEILPQVKVNFDQGIIKGPLIFIIAITLVAIGATITLNIFHSRNR